MPIYPTSIRIANTKVHIEAPDEATAKGAESAIARLIGETQRLYDLKKQKTVGGGGGGPSGCICDPVPANPNLLLAHPHCPIHGRNNAF